MLFKHTQNRNAFTTAAFLAAVWAIGAAWQPTSTYHLAPLLVAGIVPGMALTANRMDLAATSAAGAVLAMGIGVALAAADLLRGPTLLPYGGALAETITFAAVGAISGTIIGRITAMTRAEPAA